MNFENIRDFHDGMKENEELIFFFEVSNHSFIFVTLKDKITLKNGDLIVEQDGEKHIISIDKIVRICKRRVPNWD